MLGINLVICFFALAIKYKMLILNNYHDVQMQKIDHLM